MKFSRFHKQTAVYWANPVADGFGGFTFDAPVELSSDNDNAVRWEETQEKFVDSIGEEHLSRAIVYLTDDVEVGEYLMLGELADLDSSQNPEGQEGAYRVMRFSKTPNVRGTQYERKAWL